jgi:VanZ family protein
MRNPLNPSQTKTLFQFALGGYWLALFIATHLPLDTPLLPVEIDNVDKVYHFTAYAILAGLLATTWQLSSGILTGRHLRWAWVVLAIYGAADEITQIAVHRDCSTWDWCADVTGAAVGLVAFFWLSKRFVTSVSDAQ